MRVVTNTSPLLYLFRCGQIEVLPRLYQRIVVPVSVRDELSAGRTEGFEVPDPESYAWATIESVPVPGMLGLITALGAGEAEALALALAAPTDLVLLDDGRARQMAALHKLRFTGTLGILVEAKRVGLVDRVMPLVAVIRAAGFRMNDDLASAIAVAAGE